MAPAIVVVGSLNMDLVVRTPRLPGPGETLLGGPFATYPGGKGANQAVAAARLGGDVCLVGRVGADSFGRTLVTTVERDGVGPVYIRKTPTMATGVAVILVEASGQNVIVVAPGANGEVTPEDVATAGPAFQPGGVLVLQLEIPLPAVESAVRQAKAHAMTVVLNPAPAPDRPLPPELLAQVDYLVPNQSELGLLAAQCGEPLETEAAILRLHALGARNLIVTLGAAGVLISPSEGEAVHLPAYPVEVVDTVAAGDAFVGAFAVALAEGRPPLEAARWGNAAGALAVTHPGAQPSLPTRSALEAFLREQG